MKYNSLKRKSRFASGMTLTEIMIASAIFGLLMVGVAAFTIDGYRLLFSTNGKLDINADIRQVTDELADEAREADDFIIYDTFYVLATGAGPAGTSGDFRNAGDGDFSKYHNFANSSGNFLLLIYYGDDTNPDDDVIIIDKLIGYFKDDFSDLNDNGQLDAGETVASSTSRQAPIRKFEIDYVDNTSPHFVSATTAFREKKAHKQVPALSQASSMQILVNLAVGLANGDLFYNVEGRSILVNGKIIHGNDVKQITGTYNFTVATRG